MADKYVIQTDNSKSDEAVGKGIVAIFVLVAVLGAISYAYQAVVGWYNAAMVWVLETGQYLSGFWPF